MLNFRIEKRYLERNKNIIVGMDEAGRGPLAGPVAVGAVLITPRFFGRIKIEDEEWRWIDDSKKINASRRVLLYKYLNKNFRVSCGMASAKYIDKYGLGKAINKAAREAIRRLKIKPDLILLDGNRCFIFNKTFKQRSVKKGDRRLFSVACASIIAKVARDEFMERIDKKWPQYNFKKHKGYGTKEHFKNIFQHGPCPLHRLTFAPLKYLGWRKSSFAKKHGSAGEKISN